MRSPTRVLVVDDEEVLRQMVGRVLKYMGMECDSATDGFLALEKMKGLPFDIVIADIRMPNMDGIELLKIVRKEYPDTDVIIMTAHSAKYSYVDVVESGAVDFINKPFSVEELKAKVGRVMQERTQMQEFRKRSQQLERAYEELLALKDKEASGGPAVNFDRDFLARELERLKRDNEGHPGSGTDS